MENMLTFLLEMAKKFIYKKIVLLVFLLFPFFVSVAAASDENQELLRQFVRFKNSNSTIGGKSLVQLALEAKDVELLMILLERDADFKDGMIGALQMVIDSKDDQLFRRMVKRMIKQNQAYGFRDKDGRSLLQIAIDRNISDVIFLEMAIETEDEKAVEALLNRGVDPNLPSYNIKSEESSFLEMAIQKENERVVKLLWEKGAVFRSDTLTRKHPFHEVVKRGDKKMAELFLSLGIDVDVKDIFGTTALLIAVKEQNDKMVAFLLDRGADPNVSSSEFGMQLILMPMKEHIQETGLSSAVFFETEIKKMKELNYYVDTIADMVFTTPLYEAVLHDNEVSDRILILLLDAGADPDYRNYPTGLASLHRAAAYGRYKNVQLLLDRGANPNIEDKKSNTPMDYAVQFANPGAKETAAILWKRDVRYHFFSLPQIEQKIEDNARFYVKKESYGQWFVTQGGESAGYNSEVLEKSKTKPNAQSSTVRSDRCSASFEKK